MRSLAAQAPSCVLTRSQRQPMAELPAPACALIVGGGVVSGASSPNNTQLVLSTGNHPICKKPQNVA